MHIRARTKNIECEDNTGECHQERERRPGTERCLAAPPGIGRHQQRIGVERDDRERHRHELDGREYTIGIAREQHAKPEGLVAAERRQTARHLADPEQHIKRHKRDGGAYHEHRQGIAAPRVGRAREGRIRSERDAHPRGLGDAAPGRD